MDSGAAEGPVAAEGPDGDPGAPATHETQEAIVAAVAAFRADPHDASLRSAFLESLYAASRALAPQTHLLHAVRAAAAEAILVVGVGGDPAGPAAAAKARIAANLLGCIECISIYYAARSAFFAKYSPEYHAEDMWSFKQQLLQWDRARHQTGINSLIAALDAADADQDAQRRVRKQALHVIFEILNHPETIRDRLVDQAFVTLLKKAQRLSRLNLRDSIFPGMVVLSAHADPDAREWAQASIRKAGITIPAERLQLLSPILIDIVEHLRRIQGIESLFPNRTILWSLSRDQDAVWSGILCILSAVGLNCTATFLKMVMPDADRIITTSFMRVGGSVFWERLHFFRLVLIESACAWLGSRESFPQSTCALVFQNVALSAELGQLAMHYPDPVDIDEAPGTTQRRLEMFFEWIQLYAQRVPADGATGTHASSGGLLPESGQLQLGNDGSAIPPTGAVQDPTSVPQTSRLGDCIKQFLDQTVNWSLAAKAALAPHLLRLLDLRLNSITLSESVVAHILLARQYFVDTESVLSNLLSHMDSIVQHDIAAAMFIEKQIQTTKLERSSGLDQLVIHSHVWTAMISQPLWDEAISTLIPHILPMCYSSFINSGSVVLAKTNDSQSDSNDTNIGAPHLTASAMMLLTIRNWVEIAVDRQVDHVNLETKLELLTFNDMAVQTRARQLMVSAAGVTSFHEALAVHADVDRDRFFRCLFKIASSFNAACNIPTECLASAQGVLDLLRAVGHLVFDSSGDEAQGVCIRLPQNSIQCLHLWLHSHIVAFVILKMSVSWSKSSVYSSREIKQLGIQAIDTIRVFFGYVGRAAISNDLDVIIIDWTHESIEALLVWAKSKDAELRQFAISLIIDILAYSSQQSIVFEEGLFRRVCRLRPYLNDVTENQGATFAVWVSQHERHHGFETGFDDNLSSSSVQQVVPPSSHVQDTTWNSDAMHGTSQWQPEPSYNTNTNKSLYPVIDLSDDMMTYPSIQQERQGHRQQHASASLHQEPIVNPTHVCAPTRPVDTLRPATVQAPSQQQPGQPPKRIDPNTIPVHHVQQKPQPQQPLTLPQQRQQQIPRHAHGPNRIGIPIKPNPVPVKGSKLQQMRTEAIIDHCRNAIIRPAYPRQENRVFDARINSRDEIIQNDAPEREKRSIKTIDLPHNASNSSRVGRLIQTAATMMADSSIGHVKNLYRSVLSWSVDMPANKFPPAIKPSSLQPIPDVFRSAADYARTFEPLLQIECWEDFMQSRMEMKREDAICVILNHIALVDDMNELTFSSSMADFKMSQCSENQIIQFSQSQGRVSFLGRLSSVSHKKGTTNLIVNAYLSTRAEIMTHLRPSTKWDAVQVFSLTTTLREYQAMLSLPSMPLSSEFLRPVYKRPQEPNPDKVEEYVRVLNVNVPQARAIAASIEQPSGFVLIQGPPGTGKTKTILGLIGAMHRASTPIRLPTNGNNPHPLLSSMSSPVMKQGQKPGQSNRNGGNSDKPDALAKSRLRLLCCAPSNAAIDEIARRLMEGIRDARGELYRPRIVRVGSTSVHHAVRDITLDQLVEKYLKTDEAYLRVSGRLTETEASKQDMMQEMTRLREERDTLRALETAAIEDSMRSENSVTTRLHEILARLGVLRKLMNNEVKTKGASALELERARRALRSRILANAEVVLTTLSGVGHDQFLDAQDCKFPTVIVDEACQAVELSCLIPLRYGATKCIMVGDPNQLPPTVLSQVAQQFSYDQSLFQRIMKTRLDSIHLLSIQYRMHPQISQFPSQHFYDSLLTDADGLHQKCAAPWHDHRLSRPYLILDAHEGVEQAGKTKSIYNVEEARICVKLVKKLCLSFPNVNFALRIGIITFYKLQMRKLKDMFISAFGHGILDVIDINTVDGFQGQEKDIIILSCVRSTKDRGVGFVSDVRRMNVALTRARHSLIVLANTQSLRSDPVWRALVDDAKTRGVALKIVSSSLQIRNDASFRNLVGSAGTAAHANGSSNGVGGDTRSSTPSTSTTDTVVNGVESDPQYSHGKRRVTSPNSPSSSNQTDRKRRQVGS